MGRSHVSTIVPIGGADDDDDEDELELVDELDELEELEVDTLVELDEDEDADELELEDEQQGGGSLLLVLDELDELSELATLDDKLDESLELEADEISVELEDPVLLDEFVGGAELDEVDEGDADGAGFCVTGVLLHATSATASIPAARTAMCFIPLP